MTCLQTPENPSLFTACSVSKPPNIYVTILCCTRYKWCNPDKQLHLEDPEIGDCVLGKDLNEAAYHCVSQLSDPCIVARVQPHPS